ncbi:MAG: hypothetical protein ACP5IM_04920 [Candidatus Bathyarchaeia archaeon]|nr:MAG: hypothetical protein C0195_00845 [Candidatus Bathyarchaeota archaeon]
MKPLTVVYWLRVAFGILAALLCIGYEMATGTIINDISKFSWSMFLNGISLALVVYLLSYYVIKAIFTAKVEKPQKLFTMGIGIYFLAWIVFWILLYTIMAGPPPSPSG